MRDRGLAERARRAREAHSEVTAAFLQVKHRKDEADPRTKRWLEALKCFAVAMENVLPPALAEYVVGIRPISQVHTSEILELLDPDILFFRSGYIKQTFLRDIKRRHLSPAEWQALQGILLKLVRNRDCREFRIYCNAAAAVDDENFRSNLNSIVCSSDKAARRRAQWMLASMDQATRIKESRLKP